MLVTPLQQDPTDGNLVGPHLTCSSFVQGSNISLNERVVDVRVLIPSSGEGHVEHSTKASAGDHTLGPSTPEGQNEPPRGDPPLRLHTQFPLNGPDEIFSKRPLIPFFQEMDLEVGPTE